MQGMEPIFFVEEKKSVLYFQNMETGEILTTPGKCVLENALEDFVVFEGYYVDYVYNSKKINIYMQSAFRERYSYR